MPSIRQMIPQQFSLRTALVFLSLVGVLLGWTTFERDQIERRRQIITGIRDGGGQAFERQTARKMGFDFPGEEPRNPPWLKRLLVGETVQDRPQWAILSGPSITDEDLVPLQELKTLRHLSLNRTRVTDAGVATLTDALPRCEVHRY